MRFDWLLKLGIASAIHFLALFLDFALDFFPVSKKLFGVGCPLQGLVCIKISRSGKGHPPHYPPPIR